MYTLREPVRRAEQLFTAREAVVCGGARRSYGELAERVRRIAGLLETITEPGDRVAVWALNSDRYLELFIGIPCADRVIVPHNTRWAEPELLYSTVDAGAVVLICDRDPGALADVVHQVIRLDTGEYDELLAAAPQREPAISPDSLAGLFYTGGTTGTVQGRHAHARQPDGQRRAHPARPTAPERRPLPDDGADVPRRRRLRGARPAMGRREQRHRAGVRSRRRPRPHRRRCHHLRDRRADDARRARRATDADPRDVSSLRWLSHGASPVAVEVLRRAATLFGCELIHLYGATELSPLATVFRHEEQHLDGPRAKSCGQPAPGVDLGIVDADGRPVPAGDVGEVVVRGPNVMAGYWNKPEQTAAALLDGGWYRTGDLGHLDPEGYLFLVDRAKDMIVTGGENVYCTEVEDALYTHTAVLEATVFGIPDEQWGEAVHAVVVPRADAATVTEQALIDHCRGLIAGYKLPKSISFQPDPLPKSGPGKVLKRTLRAPYWEGRTTQIN